VASSFSAQGSLICSTEVVVCRHCCSDDLRGLTVFVGRETVPTSTAGDNDDSQYNNIDNDANADQITGILN